MSDTPADLRDTQILSTLRQYSRIEKACRAAIKADPHLLEGKAYLADLIGGAELLIEPTREGAVAVQAEFPATGEYFDVDLPVALVYTHLA